MHNFKKYVGTSVKAYVIEKRLEDAVNWLKISNLTATEICYRTGFQTPAYFSKYFKMRYKLTPNEYRLKFNKEFEK
jgi:AraC-like DNA-binding protein